MYLYNGFTFLAVVCFTKFIESLASFSNLLIVRLLTSLTLSDTLTKRIQTVMILHDHLETRNSNPQVSNVCSVVT